MSSVYPRDYVAPPGHVSLESLASGEDRILSRVMCGRRAILFVHLSNGQFGVVLADFEGGEMVRVRGVTRVRPYEVAELEAAVSTARRAYEAEAA